MQDRRRHPRMPSRVRVWVTCPARTLFVHVHDVSAGGMGVHVPSGFQRGDEVTCLLNGDNVERAAVVAWVEGPAFGLRYRGD